MQRYKLTLAYEGTAYSGWQVQANGKSTIQPLVQKALETVLRHPIQLTGSSRTDAGVHAKGQVAHFDTPAPLDLSRLRFSLNALLPPDIRALEITPAPPHFHARYSTTSKIYHYHIHLDPVLEPFYRHTRLHVKHPCNLNLLEKALPYFVGKRDFTSFSNQKESEPESHVRTMFRLDLVREKGGFRLEFEADGFLYKMVRNITGTLLEVAGRRWEPEEVAEMFAAKDRGRAGRAAPAHGLFLVEVKY